MSLHPSASPLLLFETRRLHACLPGEPPRHRSEAIAHRALYPGPLTDELLARIGWQHVRIGVVPHLIGDRAVELARVIPGIDEPTYPLAGSVEAPRIDEVAVRCLLQIIECVLGADEPAGALRVLVPARGRDGNHLWQTCLPEALH